MKRSNSHGLFSLDNFNDGFISEGRFFVYLPEHPRSDHGYIRRYIAAYEFYTGEFVEIGYDVHHLNGNSLDDSRDNLVKMRHGEHSTATGSEHFPTPIWYGTCPQCKRTFTHNKHTAPRNRFCSRECYQDYRFANPTPTCPHGHDLTLPGSVTYYKGKNEPEAWRPSRKCVECNRERARANLSKKKAKVAANLV